MITEALRGWLLHQRAVGNSSTQVTLFTRERGLVSARVQGGRSAKKQALLQLFTPLWLVLDERTYSTYVRQVEVISASYVIPGSQAFAGLYLNELLYRALRPHEHEPVLFEAYEDTVRQLVEPRGQNVLEGLLRRFEWILLETSGLHVSYTHESNTESPIVADQQYAFVPGEGFIYAQRGLLGAHVLAMATGMFDSVDGLKTAKYIMRRAIDHLLDGVTLHSRALYRTYSTDY